jgi:hypothetical protein
MVTVAAVVYVVPEAGLVIETVGAMRSGLAAIAAADNPSEAPSATNTNEARMFNAKTPSGLGRILVTIVKHMREPSLGHATRGMVLAVDRCRYRANHDQSSFSSALRALRIASGHSRFFWFLVPGRPSG